MELNNRVKPVGTIPTEIKMVKSTMSSMGIRKTFSMNSLKILETLSMIKVNSNNKEGAINMEGLDLMTFSNRIRMLNLGIKKINGNKMTINHHSSNGKSSRTNSIEIQ